MRTPVTPEMIGDAARWVTDRLSGAADRDWSVPAGELEWSCLFALDHVRDCFAWYAGLLATRCPSADAAIDVTPEVWPGATPAKLLATLEPLSAILADVARAAPADARAWHAFGTSDAEGFCAMACDELLVHGGDIAQGLALDWTPPREITAATVRRLFPDAALRDDEDPWTVLWWANGRADAPGRPRRTGPHWRWHSAPLAPHE